MANVETRELKFKKGQIIYRAGSFELCMYNIMLGRIGIFMDYGTAEERMVLEMTDGDFLNVISFLESRPRNTTAVALEATIVHEITYDNFSEYFRQQPAKIMSLMQHMSARMRNLQKAYLDACDKLEQYADQEKLQKENAAFSAEQARIKNVLQGIFGSNLGNKE